MVENTRNWWSRKLWILVLFPVLAALLMIPVNLLQSWLHRWYGPREGPITRPRATITLVEGYRHITNDLQRREQDLRVRMRYLTLWHRQNDPRCSDADLEEERRTLRELVRALSIDKAAPLEFIDPEQLVLPLNLESVGWEPTDEWRKLLAHYRYGLSGGSDENLTTLRQEVEKQTQDRLPVVRGDWFVVAVSRQRPEAVPEAAQRLAKQYSAQTMDAAACARELGLSEEGPLLALIRERDNLQQEFGLAPLLRNDSIRREWWESDRFLFSPYQELARLLKLGQPVRIQ